MNKLKSLYALAVDAYVKNRSSANMEIMVGLYNQLLIIAESKNNDWPVIE